MERQSDKHSPRLDEAMQHEVESLTRGTPIEARTDSAREMEGSADGEPSIEGIVDLAEDPTDAGTLSHFDVRRRSELAIHLRPSIFPAGRDEIVECARDEDAPADLLDALERLEPARSYRTTEEVWEALGGDREERTPEPVTVPVEPAPTPAPALVAEVDRDVREPEPATRRFTFRFDRLHRILALPFGITPGRAHVEVDQVAGTCTARFGPWVVSTSLSNISDAQLTGGYFPAKTVGPAHLSFTDRGLTFATNDERGVCISFEDPVAGIGPLGVVKHPALTVTVEDAEQLVDILRSER